MKAGKGKALAGRKGSSSSTQVDTPATAQAAKPDELIALSRVAAAISGLTDLDTILRVGLDTVLAVLDRGIGGIMLLDDDTGTLSYRVYHGISDDYAREMRIRLGEGIAGKVAESARAAMVEDISQSPEAAHPELISKEGLKAFVSVPLMSRDRVLGVMNIASNLPHQFTEKDIHLLYATGDLLGMAIEQARLYGELRRSRERYRQLVRFALMAQEEERRRISRELHDETSQALSGLVLNLQAVTEMVEMAGIQDARLKETLKKAHGLAVEVGNEIHRLIVNLRPTLLDSLGLVPALRQHAQSVLEPLGISLSFHFDELGRALPKDVETNLFRVAQGAIGNIQQHSRATSVSISLMVNGNELVMTISDNGIGFDVSQIKTVEPSGRGAGLFSMKERVQLMGGTCNVKSQPGRGTTVTVRVPIQWRTASVKDKGASS